MARSELNMLGSTRYKWYRSKEKTHSYFVFFVNKLSIKLLLVRDGQLYCTADNLQSGKILFSFS